MTSRFKMTLLALSMGATLVAALPAQADPYGHHGRGYGYGYDNRYTPRPDYRFNGDRYDRWDSRWVRVPAPRKDVVVINTGDRTIIRNYLSADYRRLPPGHAKRYLIGAPLPRDIVYYPVPQYVLTRLAPVPRGYEYVRVDNDVLLIAQATGQILDAVATLSRV